jgi:periplasmic protein TonB
MRALFLSLLIQWASGVELCAQNGDSAQVSPLRETEIYDLASVEEQPQFVGGEEARIIYIKKNFRYPKDALKKGIQGKVYIEFTVDRNGKVTDVSVKKGVHASLDAAAKRVVADMPNWIPGKLNGKPVNVKFLQRIDFTLK